MVDPRIVEYIKANRRHYTDQAIRQRLLDAGYSAADIDATWAAVDIPDPDRTIGPRFWRYFWIWVLVTYALGFLLVALPTGMLTGFGMVAAFFFAALLGVALLISWAIVAAVQPARLSAPVALAIGGIVPFLFLFLVAGTCYALVGSFGPPPEPARSGTMELAIDPPLEFSASGPAYCQSHGEATGYGVYTDPLGVIDGRAVTVSLDVFASGDPNAPGTDQPNLFINLSPTAGSGEHVAYGSSPESSIELDAVADGSSGTVAFENLTGSAFAESGEVQADVEPISGSLSWSCD
jgi:hypothetical protein